MTHLIVPARRFFIYAAIGLCIFAVAGGQAVQAAESGCVTCHLDKEMLIKTAKAEVGQKSAMQSGAG